MVSGAEQLPPLRQDLNLSPGPDQDDGAPSWMLHDPAANRFYQIGWIAFEILSRWQLGSSAAIVAAVNTQTTLRVSDSEVEAIAGMLHRHHLLQPIGPQAIAQLRGAAEAQKLGKLKWLLKHYLFFRVPLVHPERWLARTAPHVRFMFHPGFWWCIVGVAVLGLFLVSRRWDEFTHTFSAYSGLQGLLGIGVALSLAKVLHELGHAFTAQRFGCRVPTMGAAFLVMLPVLYTDTNEAWKLPSKRQRLAIGAAGMLTELALAACATLAWNFLPEGPVRAGAFMLATTTWIATLAINASPFMRFDGYFLLSDWLGVPNLHTRAFALARAWLRRHLLGLYEPDPESFSPERRRLLIGFAFATWFYRLVLFAGIALLVYHTFFKALGILLFIIEVGWFIVLPLLSEIRIWWRRRAELHWNRTSRRSALLLCGLALALAVPWQGSVSAPAVLGAERAQGFYAPAAGQVQTVAAREGRSFSTGQELLRLRSPELEHELALARVQEQALRQQVERQNFDAELIAQGPALRKRWLAAQEAVVAAEREIDRLRFVMPFPGQARGVSQALVPGTWVHGGERLFDAVSPRGVKIEALVDEDMAARLRPGLAARFHPGGLEQGTIRCTVSAVDRLAMAQLDSPYLASVYGGPVPARLQRGQLEPLGSRFRVRLSGCDEARAPQREWPGVAIIDAERQSLAGRGLRWALGRLQAEASL